MCLELLFIEDNEDILLNLFSWFEEKNYRCDCARNGRDGLDLAINGNFGCIVLDIMLPGIDGLEICRQLRKFGKNVPIIMLTARDAVADRVAGLDAGADDYLVKPFSLRELEARIKAVLRRGKGGEERLHFADIEMDPGQHKAFRQGIELRLSPTCFKILQTLLQAAPNMVRKESLESMLWGEHPPEGSALRNHIHELRKVLDKPFAQPLLETAPHIGWRLKLPNQ